MYPTDLSKYSVSDIEKGYQILKYEQDQRVKPLKEKAAQGKELTAAEEEFLASAGNLIDEWRLVEEFKKVGNVSEVASKLTADEKTTLSLILMKADQVKPMDTSKALKCL